MSASARRKMVPEDLLRFITLSDARISPDGEMIAHVRTHVDEESKEFRSSIWMAPAAGGQPFAFTRNPKGSDSSPRWSPDGRTLAFLSDRGGDKQIWLIDRYGGEARPLTSMRNGAGSPVWSPDGKRIAFSSAVGPEDHRELLTRTKTEAEKKADEKRAKDEARSFSRIYWRADAVGIKPNRFNQIWMIEVPEQGTPAPAPVQITWGDYDHTSFHWSPDGRQIAFGAKRTDDEHARVFDTFLVEVPGSESPAAQATAQPSAGGEKVEGEAAKARDDGLEAAAVEAAKAFQPINLTGGRGICLAGPFSPDGATLAVIGHENQYENATQFSIYLFPVGGGEARRLENWDLEIGNSIGADVRTGASGVEITWAPDGNVLYLPVCERGTCGVFGWPVAGGKPQLIAGGDREIFSGSFDRNCETLGFIAGKINEISELHVMDCREFEEQRLTDVNAALVAELDLPETVELRFKARDGWDLHGWLMKPVGFEPGRQYPLVLNIHGGPHTCFGHTFYQEFQLLAAAGYGVLFINPRGSTSYGQAFVNAVRGDYGHRDYEDLMDGVDHALTLGWVDTSRLAVTGGSYGGYMTNWVVTQTDRFAAAVSHRSISNWVSFSGTPDFGPFFNRMQHLVEDPWSPEGVEALWRISPLKYVKQVKTPLALMHSEFDYRCPIEQAEQFYMAIKYYNQAPTELVRHPRSNHDLTRLGPPSLRVDRFQRILKWFGQHCPVG